MPLGQQAARHVTGVTERVFGTPVLTSPLQLVNLICAIAPVPRVLHRRSDTPPQSPTSPRTTRRFRTRNDRFRRLRAQKRSRWTRRSPARSTTHPWCLPDDDREAWASRKALCGSGVGSVGAEPASLEAAERCFQASGRLGDQPKRPVMRWFRPRCAAAECPRAVRGPQPRGNGGVRRACGWT